MLKARKEINVYYYHHGGKQGKDLIEHIVYTNYSAKNRCVLAHQFLITITESTIIWGKCATLPRPQRVGGIRIGKE